MPKVTQISLINTATTATSFMITDNSFVRRINYNNLKSTFITDILESGTLIGPTGPQGFSGYSGRSGFSGISGFSGRSGYSGLSGYSGMNPGPSGYSGYAGVGVPVGGNTGTFLVKLSSLSYDVGWTSTNVSGGIGLMSRTNIAATTTNIANSGTSNITFNGYKGYALYKIQTSHAAFVTIYSDVASRTADAARSEITDPNPGSGVIAEVITLGNQTVKMTPAVIGYIDENTSTTYIPARVKNLSGTSTTITVTLTILGIEQ